MDWCLISSYFHERETRYDLGQDGRLSVRTDIVQGCCKIKGARLWNNKLNLFRQHVYDTKMPECLRDGRMDGKSIDWSVIRVMVRRTARWSGQRTTRKHRCFWHLKTRSQTFCWNIYVNSAYSVFYVCCYCQNFITMLHVVPQNKK